MNTISKVIKIHTPSPRVQYRHNPLVPTRIRGHAAHVLVYHILRILPVGRKIIQQRPIALPTSPYERKIAEMRVQPRAKVAESYRIIVASLQDNPYHTAVWNHIQRSVQCRALELHKPMREAPIAAVTVHAEVEHLRTCRNLLRKRLALTPREHPQRPHPPMLRRQITHRVMRAEYPHIFRLLT